MADGRAGVDMLVPGAKTAVPHTPLRHVSRPRLLAMLDAAEPGRLVLVSAPAGYGKTLLLAEWVAARPDHVAWVSLDDDDTTAHRFWSAVLSALVACPAVPEGSALHGLVAPHAGEADPSFLHDLVAALAALPAPVALVLDDVHELTAPAPVRALAALVRERPPALRLVLSGRTDPPVSIARLRLSGELCEIRARDLAFSTGEADALLTGADVVVAPEHVQLLVGQTDGWAAGLRLAALSLRDTPDAGPFLADLVGNSKATSDYLVGEILSRLPTDVCDLMRAVSVCDPLTASLAASLSERADAGEVLAALEQETSLVLSSGEGKIFYRIHPLLRSHLRADLGRRRPELVGRLHGRAAAWFAARDQAAPALLHARVAGDPARVRALLERHVTALVATGDHAAVRDAVGFLVEHGGGEGAVGDPFVLLVEALLAAETSAVSEVERHLARAAAAWPAAPEPALTALRALVRSRSAGMAGDPARMAQVAAELDAVGPRVDPELVAMGRLDSALTELGSGRAGAARGLAEEVLADAREHEHGYLAARALAVLAAIAAAEGDYGRTAMLGDLADEALSRGPWQATAGAGLVTAVRAYAALLDVRPVRCLDLLGPPRPAGSGIDALGPIGGALRAASLTDLGHGAEAVPELRPALVALATQPAPAPLLAMAALLVHDTATGLGHHDVAAELARLAEDVLGPTGDVVVMQARRTRSGSRPDRETAAGLRSVADGTTPVVVNWVRIEAGVILCDLALADGRRPQARHELDRALHAAATSGALRPLLAGGPAVVDLLARQLGSFGAGDVAAARLLELSGHADSDDLALTGRERDVLALLATSLSLRDIAAQLDVAPSTVKTHLRAVYGKLGVTSRREAVAAGRRRGVLGRP